MIIYVLHDCDDTKSIHKTREGARKALVQILRDDYKTEELENFAHQDGYKTIETYLAAILEKDDFDESYGMDVAEFELED